MTKSTNTPAFSAKAAAAAWIAGNAAAKKSIRNRVAETAAKSPRKRWAALLKDIDAADKVRVKARATGDWSAVNAAREEAPAKPKASPKAKAAPKAKAPAKREAPKAKVSAVDAAMGLAALIDAGMADSSEAATLMAYIRNA